MPLAVVNRGRRVCRVTVRLGLRVVALGRVCHVLTSLDAANAERVVVGVVGRDTIGGRSEMV